MVLCVRTLIHYYNNKLIKMPRNSEPLPSKKVQSSMKEGVTKAIFKEKTPQQLRKEAKEAKLRKHEESKKG